jgi:cytochrome c biogenesis protein ResB
MKKEVGIGVLILLLILPMVSAGGDIIIFVRAESSQGMVIDLMDPVMNNQVFGRVYPHVNDEGDGETTYSTYKDQVVLKILFVDNGRVTKTEEYGPYAVGEIISLDLREKELEVNLTESNETETDVESSNDSKLLIENNGTSTEDPSENPALSFFTGFITSVKEHKTSSIIYTVVGIVMIVGITIFLVHKRKKVKKEIKITKLSEIRDSKSKQIGDLEDKLKEIVQQLEELKKEDNFPQQKKLEEKKEELKEKKEDIQEKIEEKKEDSTNSK